MRKLERNYMEKRINDISKYLRQQDIKPSLQRIKIYEYLDGNHKHPTVDDIYKALIGSIPTLSKTTVYNTLSLFVDKGIIRQVDLESGEAHYDADLHMHGHFKCSVCGEIIDFDVDYSKLYAPELDGCIIDEHALLLKGKCNKCRGLKS